MFGGIVGRVTNRITLDSVKLLEKEFNSSLIDHSKLTGPYLLHSGEDNLINKRFNIQIIENGIECTIVDKSNIFKGDLQFIIQ